MQTLLTNHFQTGQHPGRAVSANLALQTNIFPICTFEKLRDYFAKTKSNLVEIGQRKRNILSVKPNNILTIGVIVRLCVRKSHVPLS